MRKFVLMSMFFLMVMLYPHCVLAVMSDSLTVNYGGINTTVTVLEGDNDSDANAYVGPFSPFLPVTGYVILSEPAGEPAGISDYLVNYTGLSLVLYSDGNIAFPPDLSGLTQLASIPETGLPQSVGNYFGIGADQIIVTSVPEPATLILLGLGGLALLRRKR